MTSLVIAEDYCNYFVIEVKGNRRGWLSVLKLGKMCKMSNIYSRQGSSEITAATLPVMKFRISCCFSLNHLTTHQVTPNLMLCS